MSHHVERDFGSGFLLIFCSYRFLYCSERVTAAYHGEVGLRFAFVEQNRPRTNVKAFSRVI